jgi:hypothetical protein
VVSERSERNPGRGSRECGVGASAHATAALAQYFQPRRLAMCGVWLAGPAGRISAT